MFHHHRGTASGGFTLIELLIVVAIIAILAAIAVPNLLEAQTRAKVSRTQTDMRTMATALEAYRVDANAYPPDFTDSQRGVSKYLLLVERFAHLTTPISYMSGLPEDIFAKEVAQGGIVTNSDQNYKVAGEIVHPIAYDYAKFDPSGPFADAPAGWAEITQFPGATQWAMNSPGPNAQSFVFLGAAELEVYDPTNGTTSAGNILRTSAGAKDKPAL